MFIDSVKILVKGGSGGNGVVSFRREKYVSHGGPDGGEGGRGGSVILETDRNLRTLLDFRYRQQIKAPRGAHGQGKNCKGKAGKDLVVKVPVGTQIYEAEEGNLLADLVKHGQRVTVARGGRGGMGNTHFANARYRAPRIAEKGEPGEEVNILLKLKVVADVGLVGFPNAGKSTLLSRISQAKPKIASYPFTTRQPNLGVVRLEEGIDFVVADIPGLIEGAHLGVGLGHEFLKHVERTKVLLHLIDIAATEGRDPRNDYQKIKEELFKYSSDLAQKPQIVVANKCDLPGAIENLAALQELLDKEKVYLISAVTGEGVKELLYRAAKLLQDTVAKEKIISPAEEVVHIKYTVPEKGFTVQKEEGIFIVKGRGLEKLIAMTNIENYEALQRLQRVFNKAGLEKELKKQGIKSGDTVRVGGYEFEYKELF